MYSMGLSMLLLTDGKVTCSKLNMLLGGLPKENI